MMRWYAAHVIIYFKRKKGPQKRFLVWENIVLVRAKTSDEAWEKAERLGRLEESADDGTTRIDGHPCHLVFAGVRKVTECLDPENRPTDGTEVSYNELAVPSEAAVRRLVAGKKVVAEILNPFPEEEAVTETEPIVVSTRTGT
jgi:uncharacterized protein DUF4288